MRERRLSKRQDAVERSEVGDAFSELVIRVFRLEGMLSAAGDALAAPVGQSSARWRVLAAVEAEPRSVAQIARAWSLARQSVQRVADILERERLVVYEDNPAHRRAKLVRLTVDGHRTLRRIQAAQRAWADEAGEQIGRTTLEAANAALARIIENLAQRRAMEDGAKGA
jgi:DNA-binding MarR family transcriptional regulator